MHYSFFMLIPVLDHVKYKVVDKYPDFPIVGIRTYYLPHASQTLQSLSYTSVRSRWGSSIDSLPFIIELYSYIHFNKVVTVVP